LDPIEEASALDDLKKLWGWLQTQLPAIALSIYNSMKQQVVRAKINEQKAEMKVDVLEANNAIDKSLAGKSDDDIIREYVDGTGGPKQGPPK
jgi:hypothetical protein